MHEHSMYASKYMWTWVRGKKCKKGKNMKNSRENKSNVIFPDKENERRNTLWLYLKFNKFEKNMRFGDNKIRKSKAWICFWKIFCSDLKKL